MFHRRAKARGFTLLELLVAMVLLAIMVGIVSTVLSQSSKVVTFSEVKIRQNNAASSLSQALRDYLRRASTNGVLCITDASATDSRPRLVLTMAGPAFSATGKGRGNGAFAVLGLVDNKADANTPLLWLPTYVLKPFDLQDTGTDIWANMDFSRIQGFSRRNVDANVINQWYCTGAINNLCVPPSSIADVGLLWQVAATGVSKLSIMWTDGTTTADSKGKLNLNWFGRDINDVIHPRDLAWNGPTRDNTYLDTIASLAQPEYKGAGNAGNDYRVLWTHENQNYWPKAIKIRFRFSDPSLPPEFQSADYEVIGTIGQ